MAKKLINDTSEFNESMTAEQLDAIAFLLPDTMEGRTVRAAMKPGIHYHVLLGMLRDNCFSEALEMLADIRLTMALTEHDSIQLSELEKMPSIGKAPIGGYSESKVEHFLQQCRDRLEELRKEEQ